VPFYRKAFQEYGIDVARLEREEAIDLIHRSEIRNHLLAALSDWEDRLPQGEQEQVLQESAQIKALLRQPIFERKEFEDRDELERFLQTAPIAEIVPAQIHRILTALHPTSPRRETRASLGAVDFIRRAQALYPADFWINHDLAVALHSDQPRRLQEEAVGFYRVAVALRPDSPGARVNLGFVLKDLGRLDEAITAYQKAIDLKPDYAAAHNNLGTALDDKGMWKEAIAEYRKAIELKPGFAAAHSNLGITLRKKGRLDEAITECRKAVELELEWAGAHKTLADALSEKGMVEAAITEYRTAIRLKPDYEGAHTNLGADLLNIGMLEEAISELRKSIQLKPHDALAHVNLGADLSKNGMLDEAILEYRKAIELKPGDARAHANLGGALSRRDMLDEAIKECRKAIELNPNLALAYYNLGNLLRDKGKIDEAITQFRKAIDLEPDYAEAHCNLGAVLLNLGRFAEALVEDKRGHELGSKQPGWNYPSADWVRQSEKLVALDTKLHKILKGEAQPADVAERIALAELCVRFKKLYVSSFRFYFEAFAEKPEMADDLENAHRYNAACAAALAGCGQGKDADQTEDKERARLRHQSLKWLRADLAAKRQMLDNEPDKARPLLVEQMQHWQQDSDFAGVRGTEALAKLPEAERAEWAKLWQDVAALGKQAASK
jgi:tetratricopeptide (TPR) repeat protein